MTDWREGIMRILNQIDSEWMLHRIYNFLVRFYYFPLVLFCNILIL